MTFNLQFTTTAASQQITLPLNGSGTWSIDWGETGPGTGPVDTNPVEIHTYPLAGTYEVRITFTGGNGVFNMGRGTSPVPQAEKDRLDTVLDWGSNNFSILNFHGCTSITAFAYSGGATATEPPLAVGADISYLFYNCASMNMDLSAWIVTNAVNTSNAFFGCSAFNNDVTTWDMSGVTDMSAMFQDAIIFNQNIGGWNVSSCTDMALVFSGASAFNQNIGSWVMSSVTNMHGMFWDAIAFDQDISGWDTSSVTIMTNVFSGATAFNQDISGWDVSNVTTMQSFLSGASAFNQNLGAWNITSITSMFAALSNCGMSKANYQDTLAGWITNASPSVPTGVTLGASNLHYTQGNAARNSLVTTYSWTILGDIEDPVPFTLQFTTTAASQQVTCPLAGTTSWSIDWGETGPGTGPVDTNPVESHTYAAAGTYTVQITVTAGDCTFDMARTASAVAQVEKDRLDTVLDWGSVAFAKLNFGGCTNLASFTAAGFPTFAAGADISYFVRDCTLFNQDLSTWDVSNVVNMSRAFSNTTAFNGNITTWDVSGVTDFSVMFGNAAAFNQDISGWNVSSGTNMASMFFDTVLFNQNIGPWDVSNVTDMGGMFSGAAAFNQNIGGWNVAAVTDMNYMFNAAPLFNQDISGWDVSSVTNFDGMFSGAVVFDQDISSWVLTSATSTQNMFNGAVAFNQDISGWNVSNVTSMIGMFLNATAFDQNLGAWNITSVTDMSNMLSDSGLSKDNYQDTMAGWITNASPSVPTGVTLGADNLHYNQGNAARFTLVNTYSWIILNDIEDAFFTTDMFFTVNFTASFRFYINQTPAYYIDREYTFSDIPTSNFYPTDLQTAGYGTRFTTDAAGETSGKPYLAPNGTNTLRVRLTYVQGSGGYSFQSAVSGPGLASVIHHDDTEEGPLVFVNGGSLSADAADYPPNVSTEYLYGYNSFSYGSGAPNSGPGLAISGIPNDADGVNGDIYLDRTTGILWARETGAWVNKGLFFQSGNMLTGTGVPVDSIGYDGQFYYDLNTYTVYGPKGVPTPGSWTGAGQTIIARSALLSGSGTAGLTPAFGFDGDWYLDTDTNFLYGPKTGGSWNTLSYFTMSDGGSLQSGATFTPGMTVGTEGDFFLETSTGLIWGPRGSSDWSGATSIRTDAPAMLSGSGIGGLSPSFGQDGDFYFDTTSKKLYGPKSGGAWNTSSFLTLSSGGSIHYGLGAFSPSLTVGTEGDYYLDVTSGILHGPRGPADYSGATSFRITSPAFLSGSGIGGLTPSFGLDGDFYFDTAAGVVYGPKTGGAWNLSNSFRLGTTDILNGSGAPSSGLGIDGDFYIDTANNVLYGPKTAGVWTSGISVVGAEGPIGPIGPIGPVGPIGPTGAQGAQGASGNSLLSGTVNPTAGDGVDGDFFLNVATSTLYGPKASGVWPTSGTALTGGGPKVLSGPSNPLTSQGDIGDLWLNTTTFALYGPKSASGWGGSGVQLSSTTAAQQIQTGSGPPTADIGDDGSFYLDTSTGTMYGPKNTTGEPTDPCACPGSTPPTWPVLGKFSSPASSSCGTSSSGSSFIGSFDWLLTLDWKMIIILILIIAVIGALLYYR